MHKMNMKKRVLCLCLMVLLAAMLVTGCGKNDIYKENDRLGYHVSVKYDANGGSFASGNTPVIVDSFNISEMTANGEGKVEIPLLSPVGRTNVNVQNTGYFLIGWYAQRTDNGDGTYTYAQPWDFEKDRLTVDSGAKYNASEPVLTLYAAWAPEYKVEYYDLESKALLGEYKFNPAAGMELKLPYWDAQSGAQALGSVPARSGYTFTGAFYDEAGLQPAAGEGITHPGTINYENGTSQNHTLKLYTQWQEGQWYQISTAEQFVKNFSLTGYYDIQADLDFTNAIWPTAAMHGNFAGVIQGNGHTFSNISLEQTNTNKVYTGLFGSLTETASVSDLTLDNVTLTIRKGSRLNGVAYGLLAGNLVSEDSLENVSIYNSRIAIDSGYYLADGSYVIGLVCGMGNSGIDASGITCTATGDNPEKVIITVVDGTVQVQLAAEENT